jgi:hypothetical protein
LHWALLPEPLTDHRDIRDELLEHVERVPLDANTGSPQSLGQARKWLQDCLGNHRICNQRHGITSGGFTPKRLISIPDNFERHGIRISSDHRKDGIQYATLSHCWGGKGTLSLTKRKLREFTSLDIAFVELPKSFQDAVSATKALGIDHLWIDSLCIVQDSKEDWAQESRLMCKIFQNSVCNIAASDARDSTEGCFFHRDPGTMQIERMPDGDFIGNATDLMLDHPLYDRAWVFQESFLAPRSLDFGRMQIFWRCSLFHASEVYPGGNMDDAHPVIASKHSFYPYLPNFMLNVNSIPKVLRNINQQQPNWGNGPQNPRANVTTEAYAFWSRVVILYSNAKLTRSTDRAVALSGVSEALRPYFGDYAAGLWRIFLPLELLWISTSVARKLHRCRAPSWSWLSMDGPISYEFCDDVFSDGNLIATLHHIDIIDTQGPSGEMFLKGAIQLRAVLLKATWSRYFERSEEIELQTIEGKRNSIPYLPFMTTRYGRIYVDDTEDALIPTDVYCVPIAELDAFSVEEETYDGTKILGLVVEGIGENTFRRLGVFKADSELMEPFLGDQNKQLVILE